MKGAGGWGLGFRVERLELGRGLFLGTSGYPKS